MSTEHRAQSTEHRAQSHDFRQKFRKAIHHPLWAIHRLLRCRLLCYIEIFITAILRIIFKRFHLKYLIHRGNFFDIPIYIISYNRLEYLQQMLHWLEGCGYRNIIIIDNHSDYAPLLEFYKTCPHKILRMDKNYGHTVFYYLPRFFWKRIFSFYILTDPDLSPVEECPRDFVEQFMRIMCDYPQYDKVGFSLKIDDLPDRCISTIKWENQFWKTQLKDFGYSCKIYKAGIDTTFSLNTPSVYNARPETTTNAIRTGVPYQVRHLPWYVSVLDSENMNYIQTARLEISTWSRSIRRQMEDAKN